MPTKVYLSDSVYAEFDGCGINLTTENGERASNTIYLEPEVFKALREFEQRIRDAATNQKINPA